jgi:SAM-dependent methyltransferase
MKDNTRQLIGAFGRLPVVSNIIQQPFVQKQIEHTQLAYLLNGSPWHRIHPFDLLYHTDTSGCIGAKNLPVDTNAAARNSATDYAGSQPSILRSVLAELPPLDSFTFIDFGCGKGRTLLVASEFSFQDILGVELSSPLGDVARRNAAIINQQFPQRTPVRIVVADATTFPLPAGDLVLFLYNPFAAEVVAKVVAGIESAIVAEARSIYIIYYNPTARQCFDASPLLCRIFAQRLPYSPDELGYGPDKDDLVVIWKGGDDRKNERIEQQE